jgi:hypothetical protein
MRRKHGESGESPANQAAGGADQSTLLQQPRPLARGAVRLTLTEPATVPMTEAEYEQAVDALASMIAGWWRKEEVRIPHGGV